MASFSQCDFQPFLGDQYFDAVRGLTLIVREQLVEYLVGAFGPMVEERDALGLRFLS